jgi:tripeptide aminopeptidase
MDTLLERFLRYVKVDTTAVEVTEAYPSSPGQLELGRMLAEELRAMKLEGVTTDANGIVMASLPGNVPGAPTIAWIAHMDTSPESSGANVRPVIHPEYDGKDLVLPGDPSKVIRVAETDGLADLAGKTLITSDGTTLLGADDKAGIAVIMTAVAQLAADSTVPRGPIRIVFTCDEEVGRGVDKVTPEMIGATVGYTFDGENAGGIENETFSADLAIVTVTGRNIHPGLATGKMVNAIRIAGEFLGRLPWHRLAPETTSGREGFLHPYGIEGGVGEVKIRILLRSFVTDDLTMQAQVLRDIAASLAVEHPRAKIDVNVKPQYRNMVEALAREPRAAGLAAEAVRRAGLKPRFEAIRGGTDGSRLSEMGLPTPNLGVSMHNFHSPLEYACLEEMEQSVRVLVELAQLWAKEG